MDQGKPNTQLRRRTLKTPSDPATELRSYDSDIAPTASQKRKPSGSHTLGSSQSSQHKRSRGLSTMDAATDTSESPAPKMSSLSSAKALGEQSSDFHEPPSTPTEASFPDAGPITPRANRSTASSSHVDQPVTPTRNSSSSAGEPLVTALAALSIHATPVYSSTSTIDPHPNDPADSSSQHITRRLTLMVDSKHTSSQSSLNSDASNRAVKVNSATMEAIIKNELHGSVFLYEGFWDDFLPSDPATHDAVRQRISSDLLQYNTRTSCWNFDSQPFQLGIEKMVYKPLASLLDIIGRAVYGLHGFDDAFRTIYRPFSDHSDKSAKGDYPSDTSTKPDLVKAERPNMQKGAHWGDVELIIECKSHNTQADRNQAYLQLARYARAIFSHQIYRLHVFGIAVCGPGVTFVRFDRSGLLHSPGIDISESAGADFFVRRMISLLTLPAKRFGYDPCYTFIADPSNKFLETCFTFPGHQPRTIDHILCHRKCCRGRATLASCLAATKSSIAPSSNQDDSSKLLNCEPPPSACLPDEGGSVAQFFEQDIIHKRIWRDQDRPDEGETAKRFEGVFGVCQVIASRTGDDTQVIFPDLIKTTQAASIFVRTKIPKGNTTSTSIQTSNLSNAESSTPSDVFDGTAASNEEASGSVAGEAEHPGDAAPNTDVSILSETHPSSPHVSREIRIISDILMPKGKALSEAQNPLHLMYAMHDALLGIMAYAEAGMIHCDISAYNILLVDPKVHYLGSGGWNKLVKASLGNLVWNCIASEPLQRPAAPFEIEDSVQSPRINYVNNLNRGAMSVCSDGEYSVDEGRPLDKVHRDRTGTPAFISAQLLTGPPAGQTGVTRTFTHDIESLLWVMIWTVAHHDPSKMNASAKEMIQGLSQYNLKGLGKFKLNILRTYASLDADIRDFKNSWASALASVIQDLARFLYFFIYAVEPTTESQLEDPAVVGAFHKHQQFAKMTRWEIFKHVLNIFKTAILRQQQHFELDLDRL